MARVSPHEKKRSALTNYPIFKELGIPVDARLTDTVESDSDADDGAPEYQANAHSQATQAGPASQSFGPDSQMTPADGPPSTRPGQPSSTVVGPYPPSSPPPGNKRGRPRRVQSASADDVPPSPVRPQQPKRPRETGPDAPLAPPVAAAAAAAAAAAPPAVADHKTRIVLAAAGNEAKLTQFAAVVTNSKAKSADTKYFAIARCRLDLEAELKGPPTTPLVAPPLPHPLPPQSSPIGAIKSQLHAEYKRRHSKEQYSSNQDVLSSVEPEFAFGRVAAVPAVKCEPIVYEDIALLWEGAHQELACRPIPIGAVQGVTGCAAGSDG